MDLVAVMKHVLCKFEICYTWECLCV